MDAYFEKLWFEMYRECFKPIREAPKVGLMRNYQEKYEKFIDSFNSFNVTLTEFFRLLVIPLQESIKALEKQYPDTGGIDNINAFYNQWIKIVESQYARLLRSSEYIAAMNKTMSAMDDFVTARQETLDDIRKMMGMPDSRDMDALYKEIYNLGKRIDALQYQEKAL